jgi:hypothetical protein
LGTAIGVVLGAIATVLASHYYFRRSVSKSLAIYRLLSTSVFRGIAADVRANLNFRFKNRDVKELQQLIFLVANDGERAIRDVIEPLRLQLPRHVEILDASVVHKQPDSLLATVHIDISPDLSPDLTLNFPLLNKHEYFVVKMLLSGRVQASRLAFTILSDDLPRNIELREMPSGRIDSEGYKFEWSLAILAAVVLLFPAWISYAVYKILAIRPELSPIPLSHYSVSLESLVLLLPAAAFVLLFTLFGLMMMGAAIFGGEFPPRRGPKFPLPRKLRDSVFSYPVIHVEELPGSERSGRERSGRSKKPLPRPDEK